MSGQIVNIPREVAETIDRLREQRGFSNAKIIEIAMKTGGGLSNDTVILQKIPFDTLLVALVNGYEKELTEEERREKAHQNILRAYYDHREERGRYDTNLANRAYADGISDTLDWLGIEVKGVSDDER